MSDVEESRPSPSPDTSNWNLAASPLPWAIAEAWQAAGNVPRLGELISPRAIQPLLPAFLHHEKQTDVFSLN